LAVIAFYQYNSIKWTTQQNVLFAATIHAHAQKQKLQKLQLNKAGKQKQPGNGLFLFSCK